MLVSTSFDILGNTPLHLAMESAHAEAAIMLIEAGADRSRVCHVSFQQRPYFFVPNRVIVISNSGKSGQRGSGRSSRCRWARAEACQRVCYFALRSTNVRLARVQKFTAQRMYKYPHVMFVLPIDADSNVVFIDRCLTKQCIRPFCMACSASRIPP